MVHSYIMVSKVMTVVTHFQITLVLRIVWDFIEVLVTGLVCIVCTADHKPLTSSTNKIKGKLDLSARLCNLPLLTFSRTSSDA